MKTDFEKEAYKFFRAAEAKIAMQKDNSHVYNAYMAIVNDENLSNRELSYIALRLLDKVGIY